MSGGVPKRISISRTQRNTPSKAGNVMAKKAIVLCNGNRSRRAMCNYIMKRARITNPNLGPPGAGWTLVVDENFISAVKTAYPAVITKDFEVTQANFQTYFKNSTIDTITDLSMLSGKNITDLTGINGFTALQTLNVNDNNLTTLDLTNTALTVLSLQNKNKATTANITICNISLSPNLSKKYFYILLNTV